MAITAIKSNGVCYKCGSKAEWFLKGGSTFRKHLCQKCIDERHSNVCIFYDT